MKYNTRDFGQIDIPDEAVLNFVEPILGFEHLNKFGLIYDDEIGNDIMWMQSLEEPAICFILMNSQVINIEYKPVLTERQLKDLKASDILELECWHFCIIPEDFKKMTINLKSPIFMNISNQIAMQVVLEEDYPIRYAIMGEDE